MICPSCASSNSPEAVVCRQCGMAFDRSETTQASAKNHPPAISQVSAYQPTFQPSRSKFALACLVCALTAWLLIIVIFLLPSNIYLLPIPLILALFSAINGYTALGELFYAKGKLTGRKLAIVGLFLSQVYILASWQIFILYAEVVPRF